MGDAVQWLGPLVRQVWPLHCCDIPASVGALRASEARDAERESRGQRELCESKLAVVPPLQVRRLG